MPELPNGEDLAVLILNYRRPQNIGRIVRTVSQALPQSPIFVLDQAESDALRARDDIPWRTVWYRRAERNNRAGARIRLATRLPFAFYLAIDDDVFLTAAQIQGLCNALRREPERAHGLWGRVMEHRDAGVFYAAAKAQETTASVIHMVYGFSGEQARRTIALAAELGFQTWEDLKFGDDILLSCAGVRPPACHDLGEVRLCVTSSSPGIAVQHEAEFDRARDRLLLQLIQRGRVHIVDRRTRQQDA